MLNMYQACDGFLLSFILTTFLAHSFFSYLLTTFLCNSFFLTTFLQKYIFSSFEGKKLVISRQKNSLYCAKIVRFILTTFFKVFQILLYISVCHLVIIHFGGYFFFAGEYIFCLYDVRIPIFSYFLTTFSS